MKMKYFYDVLFYVVRIFLVLYSKYSIAATVCFNVLSIFEFIGAISLTKTRPHERESFPAYIETPIDLLMACYAIYVGGWMVLGGILLYFSTSFSLIAFGDVNVKYLNEILKDKK